MLNVVTVNVNGVRAAAKRGGFAWLRKRINAGEIDVVCLQEVRATTEQLHEVLQAEGLADLHVAHDSSLRLGHAGVAILSTLPLAKVKQGIGAKEFDGTGRWVQAQIETGSGPLTIASIYVHSGDAEKPVQQEKYRFLDAMTKKFQTAQKTDEPFLACGDFNVGHRELDIKNWKGNLTKAGFLPEERAYFDKWFDKVGVVDLGRRHAGEVEGPYTWWSWRGQAFDNNAGWRIDYHVANSALAAHCKEIVVGRADTYAQRWSDHAPVTAKFNL
jgi:exodeoxyribonuclease-3